MVVAPAVPPQCTLDFAALVGRLPPHQQTLFNDPASRALAARPAPVVAEPCPVDPAVAAESGSYEHAECSPEAHRVPAEAPEGAAQES